MICHFRANSYVSRLILADFWVEWVEIQSNTYIEMMQWGICDALHDLEPFAQFKKREKHPWRSVNLSKV